jgi:hypothetical protein
MALPKLGDARKRYIVELTEPEINTLAALEGFVESACSREPSPWYEHYRPHIEAIATKFEPCEDGNAPFHGEGPRDLRAGGEGAEALYRAALRAISACAACVGGLRAACEGPAAMPGVRRRRSPATWWASQRVRILEMFGL